MNIRSPILIGFAAVVLTACAMALNGAGGPGQADQTSRVAPVVGTARPQPFACALIAQERAGRLTLEGRLDAREAVSARYDLRIRGPGVAVDQSGDLSLRPGESTTLGEASLTGRLGDLDARMTVTSGGRTVTCPLRGA